MGIRQESARIDRAVRKVLRVRIYAFSPNMNKWEAVLDHVFFGDTRAQANSRAESHRDDDDFYRAAIEKKPHRGAKLQARATWVC